MNLASNKISLFWYSFYNFKEPPKMLSKLFIRRLIGREKENYGDLLSKYIVKKIAKRQAEWYHPGTKKPKENYFVIGSILNYSDEKSVIWGSGIIDKQHHIKNSDFRAVRGPLTRNRIVELGYSCPEIYGDPGLLLPRYYLPKIKKKYEIGIVPHFYDLGIAKSLFGDNSKIKIISLLTSNIEETTNEILSCKQIISSSLHGLIIAHAYNIPAVWVKFSNNLNGDNVKFEDYFLSVNLKSYQGEMIKKSHKMKDLKLILESTQKLPSIVLINELCDNLMSCCPFYKNNP